MQLFWYFFPLNCIYFHSENFNSHINDNLARFINHWKLKILEKNSLFAGLIYWWWWCSCPSLCSWLQSSECLCDEPCWWSLCSSCHLAHVSSHFSFDSKWFVFLLHPSYNISLHKPSLWSWYQAGIAAIQPIWSFPNSNFGCAQACESSEQYKNENKCLNIQIFEKELKKNKI